MERTGNSMWTDEIRTATRPQPIPIIVHREQGMNQFGGIKNPHCGTTCGEAWGKLVQCVAGKTHVTADSPVILTLCRIKSEAQRGTARMKPLPVVKRLGGWPS